MSLMEFNDVFQKILKKISINCFPFDYALFSYSYAQNQFVGIN